ncbi:MAG: polyketide cyclase, partial [Chitinophagaceae bacterium]
ITHWNFAADSWQCPTAENDLRKGGNFSYRMEAKDGSFGFDFGGIYDDVQENKRIAYTLGDNRKTTIEFILQGNQTRIVEIFEAENQNDIEMQRGGWQAILDNFRKYTESLT